MADGNDNSGKDFEFTYTILVIGESTVGKTCFLSRFINGKFSENQISTLGIDSRLKTLTLKDGANVRIQVWDTAGQEKYRTMTKNFYRRANGIVLVYDITQSDTFKTVESWMQQIKENVKDDVVVVLAGNKVDLEDLRQVGADEGEEVATKFNISFFETSAKEDININEVFQELTEQIHKKLGNVHQENTNMKLQPEKKGKKKKKKCCK